MNSKDLIKPIEYIGVGQCYACCTPLIIYENELTSLVLDKNGLPIKHDVEYCNVVGICPSCRKIHKMEKQGMHYKRLSIFKQDTVNDGYEFVDDDIKDNPFIENLEEK